MRILMLGNSFTAANNMPDVLAELLHAEVTAHTRGGARLAEHLNPKTKNGARTLAALENEYWDYVILQEMSNGPVTSKASFLKNAGLLCEKIREAGAAPLFYATWAYRPGAAQYAEVGMDYEEMAAAMSAAYHEAAEQNNALIADVGRKFYQESKKRELYAEDGSHPSEEGSRLAAETIAAVILSDRKARHPGIVKSGTAVAAIKETDSRLRTLYMYQILRKYSDAEHPLTTNQIRDLMVKEHNITMHRTTVPGDITTLQEAGINVIARRSRQNRYYLAEQQFELAELKVLIDAVESSKFITKKKSRMLVEKLTSLTSRSNAEKLKRNLQTSGRVRSGNEKGYYIVDAVNEAINDGKCISFFYTDYDGKKNQILRNGGKPYIVSPYTLIWNGDYYYMVGWNHEQEEIRTYRVDRILRQPDILEEEAVPAPKDFDAARYSREVFRMYDDEEIEDVTLVCCNEVMKGVIDVFGTDIRVKSADKDHFRTTVRVCTSPTFFAWVFQWGGKIRIEGPENVADEYRKMARKALGE